MSMTRNTKVAVICASVVAGMLGMSYAAVPLYRIFCQVTGYAGTTQRVAEASTTVIEQQVTVRFDANVAPGLDWDFGPLVNKMKLKIGENGLAFYRVTNTSSEPIVGSASFNVTPDQAGAYFNKVQCFCFTEQKLEPGESVDMPVSFFVDPAIVKDRDAAHIRNITLSYTFHRISKPSSDVAARSGEKTAPSTPAPPADEHTTPRS